MANFEKFLKKGKKMRRFRGSRIRRIFFFKDAPFSQGQFGASFEKRQKMRHFRRANLAHLDAAKTAHLFNGEI